MEGGELFQRIQDRQDGAFTERGLKKINFWLLMTKKQMQEYNKILL